MFDPFGYFLKMTIGRMQKAVLACGSTVLFFFGRSVSRPAGRETDRRATISCSHSCFAFALCERKSKPKRWNSTAVPKARLVSATRQRNVYSYDNTSRTVTREAFQ